MTSLARAGPRASAACRSTSAGEPCAMFSKAWMTDSLKRLWRCLAEGQPRSPHPVFRRAKGGAGCNGRRAPPGWARVIRVATAGLAGMERFGSQQTQFGDGFAGTGIQFHFGMVVQRCRYIASKRNCTSSRWVGVYWPGCTSSSPRRTCSTSTPERFTATRLPGTAVSSFFFMRLEPADAGMQTGRQDLQFVTLGQLPVRERAVTTVPKPGMEKTRSIGRRARPRSGRAGNSCSSFSRVCRSSGEPGPGGG